MNGTDIKQVFNCLQKIPPFLFLGGKKEEIEDAGNPASSLNFLCADMFPYDYSKTVSVCTPRKEIALASLMSVKGLYDEVLMHGKSKIRFSSGKRSKLNFDFFL